MLTQQESLTADQIMALLNIKPTAFYQAVNDLGITASRPITGDRRRLVYPPDTPARVQQWLKDHSSP